MKLDTKIKKINGLVTDLEKEVNKMCVGPNCKPKKKSKIKSSKLDAEKQANT